MSISPADKTFVIACAAQSEPPLPLDSPIPRQSVRAQRQSGWVFASISVTDIRDDEARSA